MRLPTQPLPIASPAPGVAFSRDGMTCLLALCVGIVTTFCVVGYQFGQSNHYVYLLDALRQHDPSLLANDWFTTQTFQYHAVFGQLTGLLMSVGLLEPGFLVGQIALVVAFHISWLGIVLALRGSARTYLVSVLLYYLSAGGTGLGVYQFFQDNAFLPSNVANVALLCGIAQWIRGHKRSAALGFALAGMFHLNHAIVSVLLWSTLMCWDLWDNRKAPRIITGRDLAASALALVPALTNITLAMMLKVGRDSTMPLDQFVDLYVRFRHPHHYDPRSWPIALWIAFGWSIPFAVAAWFWTAGSLLLPPQARARTETARVFVVLCALLVLAGVFAGVFYVSEPLIQMSLYRFSIYVQLLSCIGAAIFLCDCALHASAPGRWTLVAIATVLLLSPFVLWLGPRIGLISVEGIIPFINRRRGGFILFAILGCTPVLCDVVSTIRRTMLRRAIQGGMIALLLCALVVGWDRWIGIALPTREPDEGLPGLCNWVRDNTPVDAVFLSPPGEGKFRLLARRAVVVDFKCVPQLAGELRQWSDRLKSVLGVDSFDSLPHGFDKLPGALNDLYERRDSGELVEVAKQYGARYIVRERPLSVEYAPKLVPTGGHRYFLYDLSR